MTFKVGDRVRLTGEGWGEDDMCDMVVTITGVDDGVAKFPDINDSDDYPWNVWDDPDDYWGAVLEEPAPDPEHYDDWRARAEAAEAERDEWKRKGWEYAADQAIAEAKLARIAEAVQEVPGELTGYTPVVAKATIRNFLNEGTEK